MARDNFSLFFNAAAAPPPVSTINTSNASISNKAVSNFNNQSGRNNDSTSVRENGRPSSQRDAMLMSGRYSSTSAIINGSTTERDDTPITREGTKSDGDLLVGFTGSIHATSTSSAPPATWTSTSDTSNNSPQRPPIQHNRPGTESIQYLRKFGSNIGSIALKPLRELQLAERLNAMNLEMEEMQNEREAGRMRLLEAQDRERRRSSGNQSEQLSRELQEKEEEEECELIKREAYMACQRVAQAASSGRDELAGQSEQLARELQEKEEEEECELIKREADMACQRVAGRYDALVKFVASCPHGTYEEYIEFLLMGGGRTENGVPEEDYNLLLFENFYDCNSEYRKLWNDNLTMGLSGTASTMEGRAFAASNTEGGEDSVDPWHSRSTEGRQRLRTLSAEDRTRNFGQTLRERTLSEGERIKRQIAQVDRQKMIKQGLGSAVNVMANVSSFALKPLREFQIAEHINAMNIDMEEEEARKEFEAYRRMQDDIRDMEEMMKLKKEAEESCLTTTKEHLLSFIKDNPTAKYHQWIEDFHPENAHAGTLLEGLGKTIDHRLFVEESDHRRLWNENLFTFLDRNSSEGRDFVPARGRQMDDNGEMMVAADILSGSVVGREGFAPLNNEGKSEDVLTNSDLMAFD